MGNTDLRDKVVIVTGANHGIGASIAMAFAKQGAKVLINYHRFSAEAYGDISEQEVAQASTPGRAYYCKMQTQTADYVLEAIQEIGSDAIAIEADLAETENIPMFFDKAEEHLGSVDVLVNNAAYCKCDTFIPHAELAKDPLFISEFPMATISSASHDAHFAVNSQAVSLMMAEYAKRYIQRKCKSGQTA